MSNEIREVVASYVIDVSGFKVQARITAALDGEKMFLWEVSHLCSGVSSRFERPKPVPVGSRKEALEQIMDYAKGFKPGYSPEPNGSY